MCQDLSWRSSISERVSWDARHPRAACGECRALVGSFLDLVNQSADAVVQSVVHKTLHPGQSRSGFGFQCGYQMSFGTRMPDQLEGAVSALGVVPSHAGAPGKCGRQTPQPAGQTHIPRPAAKAGLAVGSHNRRPPHDVQHGRPERSQRVIRGGASREERPKNRAVRVSAVAPASQCSPPHFVGGLESTPRPRATIVRPDPEQDFFGDCTKLIGRSPARNEGLGCDAVQDAPGQRNVSTTDVNLGDDNSCNRVHRTNPSWGLEQSPAPSARLDRAVREQPAAWPQATLKARPACRESPWPPGSARAADAVADSPGTARESRRLQRVVLLVSRQARRACAGSARPVPAVTKRRHRQLRTRAPAARERGQIGQVRSAPPTTVRSGRLHDDHRQRRSRV